jgi:hypothetical protein
MTTTVNITFTLAGRTETVEAEVNGLGERAFGPAVLYGIFPTGKKAHRTTANFWAVNGTFKVHRGAIIGTDEQGREWVLDQRLYTHNRNVGRIVGWADSVDPRYIARW